MSRKKLLDELRQLHAQRRRLLRRLIKDTELAVGSVSQVKRKCGRAGCHCAREGGHLQTLFLFKDEKGIRRCKLVRRADEAMMMKAGAEYREFRKYMKELRAIDFREKRILLALMEERSIDYK